MAFPWLLQSQLEARLSAVTVQRILDDDNDGTADTDPVDQLLTDACSFVGGRLGPQYSVNAIAAMATVPSEITRLSLDAAVVYGAQRHPEVVRRDWEPLHKALVKECEDIRTGKANLGVAASPPEPAIQNGGDLIIQGYGLATQDDQPTSFTRDGFGSFGGTP